MSRMSAFQVYSLFLALKNHFTTDYDFFKYHGKTRAKQESFLKRKDRFFYQKLSRKIVATDMQEYIVANLLAGRKWVREFTDDEAMETFTKYRKVMESLSYTFENEIDSLFSQYDNPKEIFSCNGQLPPIVTEFIGNRISIQTLVILNRFVKFKNKLDTELEDDYIWSQYSRLIDKYQPFLHYDSQRMANILRQKIQNNT